MSYTGTKQRSNSNLKDSAVNSNGKVKFASNAQYSYTNSTNENKRTISKLGNYKENDNIYTTSNSSYGSSIMKKPDRQPSNLRKNFVIP